MKAKDEVIVPTLDGVCLVDMRYISPQGFNDLLNAKPGSIIRVTDINKAVRFIDYPEALKTKLV